MEPVSTILGGATWIVRLALNKLAGDVMQAWTDRNKLGDNMRDLSSSLLRASALLGDAQRVQIDNPALNKMLQELREVAYEAEDVLDELDYFRIQDELEGTDTAADTTTTVSRAGLRVATRAAKQTFKDFVSPFCSCIPHHHHSNTAAHDQPATSTQRESHDDRKTPMLEFDGVDVSRRMTDIATQLRAKCDDLSNSLSTHLQTGNTHSQALTTITNRPETTSRILEDEVFGRDDVRDQIIGELTNNKYRDNHVSVLPIVGDGGVGKTTLTQYVYNDPIVQEHFQVRIWICVSLNFDVHKITRDILGDLPKDKNEQSDTINESANLNHLQDLMEKRLALVRNCLIVLDDMWGCDDDNEWKKVLAPFKHTQGKGNMILLTTRILQLAQMVKPIHLIKLKGLGDEEFWKFFEACLFDDENLRSECNYELLEPIGRQIVQRLDGNPLAARTVARLLKENLTRNHWNRILERSEWRYQKSTSDIMPALRISYEFLSFHLKQCFSYCALFPPNHKFGKDELVHLWIAQDFIDPDDGKDQRVEDAGSKYLDELVDRGFFQKIDEVDTFTHDKRTRYMMHDLLLDLARVVSLDECLVIDHTSPESQMIPLSIRHLSIWVKNEEHTQSFVRKLDILVNLKTKNLSTLMLIGKCNRDFVNMFREVFRDTERLRVLKVSFNAYYVESYDVEYLLPNFSKLIHLRYLNLDSRVHLPKMLSRFYHLKVLDLGIRIGSCDLPKDMNNLINLRHFIAREVLHSSIAGVGKMNFLQELARFNVKKSSGFELRQLGGLMELGGSLSICNLENVENKEDAKQARLMSKSHLRKLSLSWDSEQSNSQETVEEDILENLHPPSNLQELYIKNHRGINFPTWLDSNIYVNNLETLSLCHVAWNRIPPLGRLIALKKLKLEGISWIIDFEAKLLGNIREANFPKLKEIMLADMPKFEKWIGDDTCHLFSHLEVLKIRQCPKLKELPFSQFSSTFMQGGNLKWFPVLCVLEIVNCPQLMILPPFPYTPTLSKVNISGVGSSLENIGYTTKSYYNSLSIKGKENLQALDEKVLAFHNLNALQWLQIENWPPLSWEGLQRLTSLKVLIFKGCLKGLMLSLGMMMMSTTKKQSIPKSFQLPIERLYINKCVVTREELWQLLFHLPALSQLSVVGCHPEEENEEEELLCFPAHLSTTLRRLVISDCGYKVLCPPASTESTGGRAGGVGLQGFVSLEYLEISYSSLGLLVREEQEEQGASDNTADDQDIMLCYPFPPSLQHLALSSVPSRSAKTWHGLSNLTSLTELSIHDCPDLRGEGYLNHLLLTNNNLKHLEIWGCPNFFSTREEDQQKEASSSSSSSSSSCSLEEIETNDTRILSTSICTHLSTSLHTLEFWATEVECLTEEQESALQLLTNLQYLKFFFCENLRSLPARLHTLRSLKKLIIERCPLIKSLPKEGLPPSLRYLVISGNCDEELKKQGGELVGIILDLRVY